MSFHTNRVNSDHSSFADLYNRYYARLLLSMVRKVKNREKAEDITATAFTLALEKIDEFRGESSFYTWLHAIAINELRKSWRYKQTVSLDLLDEIERMPFVVSDGVDESLEHREDRQRMSAALRQLPVHYRRVLVDHTIRGWSVKQIARRHNIPVGTVLSRIFTAKRRLCQAWEDVS